MIAEALKGKELKSLSFPLLSSVPDNLRRMAAKEGEKLLCEPLDYLPLTLYKSFLRTGSREVYETPYFRKRRRLSHLVIAEALDCKGRFLDRIEDEIWSILGEPGWVIPAHNSYIRDTPQLPLPDTSRPVLDLFAMETAEIIALTYALLFNSLEEELKATMISEIERRIVTPYISSWFWWMGNAGKEKLNNWTVWCTQNMLLAVLSMPFKEETRRAVVDKAAASIDDWYDQYSDDGCCDEGAQYWHAAPLCYWGCISILNEATDGALSFLRSDGKTQNMAKYIISVHVDGDRYLNFADCSPCAGWLGAREYLFGEFVDCRSLMRLAVSDFREQYVKALKEDRAIELYDNNYNLWYNYLEYGLGEKLLDCEMPEAEALPPFVRYDGVGLYIYRAEDTVLAVKGGCNDDSHNHNDTGSLILYKGTHPLLVDIGVETYTKTTFSSERYTLFPMQSLYHNVVNFGGIGQKAGAQYKAADVAADDHSISMELKGAYPEWTVSSYTRSVSFSPSLIDISDTIKGAEAPVLSIITMDRPAADGGDLLFDGWRIKFRGCEDIEIETIEINDKRLRIAWPDKLYRSLVSFSERLDWSIIL